MAKQNKAVKIMAFLALLWIIASILWTWILIMFWWNQTSQEVSPEEYMNIQNMINAQSWVIINTWSIENTSTWMQIISDTWITETLTWKTK